MQAHRHIKRRLRAVQGPRTVVTTWAAIQRIEATNMIRKGQVLGPPAATCTDKFGCSGPCSVQRSKDPFTPRSVAAPTPPQVQHYRNET